MDLSRWITLFFAVAYVMLCAYLPPGPGLSGGSVDDQLLDGKEAGGLFLFFGFLCVWGQEALGDMLIVGRGAWNPKRSTAGAVAALGWLFLTLALVVPILDCLYAD